MGGTHKKHKEKHRKSRKHRSRSRTRNEDGGEHSPDEKRRRRSRSPGLRYRDSPVDEREPDRNDSKIYSNRQSKSQRDSWKDDREDAEPEKSSPARVSEVKPAEGSGDVSLSIEETNKLREKLGLKPLKTSSVAKEGEDVAYEDRADVHAPASNILSSKESEKLRQKVLERKEKRRINKKLHEVRSLADDGDDPVAESAADWVRKLRELEEEKKRAKQREKMLEEAEKEFGMSEVINSEMDRIVNRSKRQKYSSKDLAGMKIEHDTKEFTEGSSVIVTLKDQGILEDSEDVLENVNMTDDRKTLKNVENRKRKSDYRPYEEVDEESGMIMVKNVLEKYDEEIDGKKEKFIRLDGSGNADDEQEREMEMIRRNLIAQQTSLQMAAPKLAMDYYTEEEMVKFKKPGKKRKIRKRATVKADDLLPLGEELNQDHGSRKRPKGIMKNSSKKQTDKSETAPTPSSMENEFEEEREFMRRIQELEQAPVEEDEAELELQMALERSRNSKVKKENVHPTVFLQKAISETDAAQDDVKRKDKKKWKGAIVMDSTSEFCRALGDLPSIDGGIQEEKMTEDTFSENYSADVENTGGWEQVTESSKKEKQVKQKYEAVLEEEPDLKVGVAAALKVASIKGFVEAKKKQANNFPSLNLPETKAVIDEEKMRDEEKDRYHRGYDRERYDPYAFKEKDSYKPDVKLEYVDEHGRPLSEKEAFRFLSHKFHGKGSGKMKTEKRAKKFTEDMKLKKMSAIDTPLNTAQMMADRQMISQTPYVVLSGGGKNLLTTNLISKK